MSVPEIPARHREEVARIWCEKINARTEMDSNLAESMARLLAKRDALIWRLVGILVRLNHSAIAFPDGNFDVAGTVIAEARATLADPALAPWRTP